VAPSSRDFVCEKFSEFYRNPSNVIPAPTATSQREFAYLLFRERAMIRHRSVVKISSLRNLFNENVPSDVYHSCAYYEYPEADMDKKGWLGADLVFDIDADHIPTNCDKIHDEWVCRTCDFSGKGITPEECPICGGLKFDTKSWPCERCIDSARDETIKLLDILEKDFGFADKDLHVFFSGHRGYHVHVEDEGIKPLDAMARKEIVDYVYGTGLLELEQPQKGKKRKRNFGWNRRIKLSMQKFILNATEEDLKAIGIKQTKGIMQNKEAIATRYIEENRWSSVRGVGTETWLKIARHVKDLESSKIDTVVTTDIHRLIRMNGTLHGKTGLRKVEFPANRLTSFDPFKEAVAFKEGTVKVSVSSAPEFRIGEDMFGPYKNKTVELPTAAAVLLILKGRAEVEDTRHV
jgi:DNA primase small subunit